MLWILCDEEKWRSGGKPFETGGNVARLLAVRAARLRDPLMLRCSQDPCCSGSNRRTTALCLLALLVTRSGVCTSLGRSCPLSPARQNLPLWDWVGFELKLLCCGWMSHVQSWALWQGIGSSSSLPEIPRFWSCPSGADIGLQLWQNVKWRHGGFLWEPEELGGGKQKSN